MIIKIRDIIAPHFWNNFNSKKTNQIFEGGRNSTKTSMISIKIVNCCLEHENCSAVALRNHKTDLRKSVYKEIKRACKRLGLIEKIDTKFVLIDNKKIEKKEFRNLNRPSDI